MPDPTPTLLSLSLPVGYIQSASLHNSLTMKDYSSTNALLTQLYSRYGGNVTEDEKDVDEQLNP